MKKIYEEAKSWNDRSASILEISRVLFSLEKARRSMPWYKNLFPRTREQYLSEIREQFDQLGFHYSARLINEGRYSDAAMPLIRAVVEYAKEICSETSRHRKDN